MPGTLFYHIFIFSFAGIMAKAPAGTLPVPGMHNTYLDKTEVTNAQWRAYRAYVKEHPEEFEEGAYRKTLPDLELWHQAYPADFERPSRYDTYPVVGISYPQVVNFCAWRSTYISAKRKKQIVYTLPTVLEFGRAAKNAPVMASGLYATSVDMPSFIGLCDNATEMTSLEGLAMAGYKGTCMDTVYFFKAQADLGFRCKAYFR